jgi:hypothetical protein
MHGTVMMAGRNGTAAITIATATTAGATGIGATATIGVDTIVIATDH